MCSAVLIWYNYDGPGKYNISNLLVSMNYIPINLEDGCLSKCPGGVRIGLSDSLYLHKSQIPQWAQLHVEYGKI